MSTRQALPSFFPRFSLLRHLADWWFYEGKAYPAASPPAPFQAPFPSSLPRFSTFRPEPHLFGPSDVFPGGVKGMVKVPLN